MYSRKKFVAALLASCFAGTALAEGSIAEQLQKINESIALLTAQKQELELRAQVTGKQAEIARANNSDASSIDRAGQPVVRAIEGADGKLKATLAFGSGVQQTVKAGEKIYGGWVVTNIAVDAVSISRGSEKVRLGYGNEPPAQTTSVPALYPSGR